VYVKKSESSGEQWCLAEIVSYGEWDLAFEGTIGQESVNWDQFSPSKQIEGACLEQVSKEAPVDFDGWVTDLFQAVERLIIK